MFNLFTKYYISCRLVCFYSNFMVGRGELLKITRRQFLKNSSFVFKTIPENIKLFKTIIDFLKKGLLEREIF